MRPLVTKYAPLVKGKGRPRPSQLKGNFMPTSNVSSSKHHASLLSSSCSFGPSDQLATSESSNMNGDLSLSQAFGGLRIANPDDATIAPCASTSSDSKPTGVPTSGTVTRIEAASSTSIAVAGNDLDLSLSIPQESLELCQSSTSKNEVSYDDVCELAEPARQMPKRSGEDGPYHSPSTRKEASCFTKDGPQAPRNYLRHVRMSAERCSPSPVVNPRTSYTENVLPKGAGEESKDRNTAMSMRREIIPHGRSAVRQAKKGVNDFSFGHILGKGSYSTVYFATDRQTLKNHAIKVLEKRHIIKEKKIKYVNIEKNTLNRLTEHPGIVRLYYTFQDEASLYYVLDLCSGGELLGVLKKTETFNVECTKFYGAQILDSIDYMHSRGVIHRDLKPENVLLNDQMHIKITDFGTARLLGNPQDIKASDHREQDVADSAENLDRSRENRTASFVGTAEYVSPELLTHKTVCKASDLWAFGCIIYQLLAGRPPFKAGSEYLTFQKIVSLDYEFPVGFPSAARDLVERCLILDPTRRLTVEHIKKHEFFDGQQFGRGLWRSKAPRLRPYTSNCQESNTIQLKASGNTTTSTDNATTYKLPGHSQPCMTSGSHPSRIITELPPPTQLDIEWSPVLTKNNERILKLGDLTVYIAAIHNDGKSSEDGHKMLSRFFGGSATKKRQRLVIITSSGRIVLAPAGGEEKKAKEELSLLAPDCSWRTQHDSKGQLVWCVDVGSCRYTFEDVRTTVASESGHITVQDWIECLMKAKNLALSSAVMLQTDNTYTGRLSTVSSPASTVGSGAYFPEARSVQDRPHHYLTKSQAGVDDNTSKRTRFSKRQSRSGLGSAF